MDESREQKKRKKNNERVIKNMNNKKHQHRTDNTEPKPDEVEAERR